MNIINTMQMDSDLVAILYSFAVRCPGLYNSILWNVYVYRGIERRAAAAPWR